MSDHSPDYNELSGFLDEGTDEITALTSDIILSTKEVPSPPFYESPSDEGPTVDITHRTPPQGPAVGSDFPPQVMPDQLKKLQRERSRIIQQREADKKPNYFDTGYNVAIPDVGTATPVQISGRHPNRKVIIISNTGNNPIYMAKNPDFAQGVGGPNILPTANGFTIGAGGVFTCEAQDAIYLYAPASAPSTVDWYEELYETASEE